MKLGLPIVWSDRHRLHEPGGEVWIGVRTPGTEVPRRAEAIRDALRARDAPFVDARPHPDDDVLAGHDAALVDYLRAAWDEWTAARSPADPGQDRVVPCVLAHRASSCRRRSSPTAPRSPRGRPAAHAASGPLGPGTNEAARAAVDTALTAADLVATREARATALVVALGVDAAAGDPEKPLDVTQAGHCETGRILGAMSLPTVLVQERGHDLTTIGALVAETPAGAQEGATRA